MQVGDKVKPVDTFDFDQFTGPEDINDTGTVLDIIGSYTAGSDTLVLVVWNGSGALTDHVAEGHTGHPDDIFEEFGVMLVDEETEEVSEEPEADVAEEAASELPTFAVGDRVKAASGYRFDIYGGPKTPEEEGTIIEIDPVFNDPIVKWDNGKVADHTTVLSNPEFDYPEFGVIHA